MVRIKAVIDACLENLGHLHDALDQGEGRNQSVQRTLFRDGGFGSRRRKPLLDLGQDLRGVVDHALRDRRVRQVPAERP